uniref:FAD-binding domain-containing protein n=1 Tax=Romanomermis culicivorax TaxID=13658 RepID=A0A915ID02_ROMCU
MDILNESQNSAKKVVIVGGGLTGALNACFFAKRGWRVELYEFRTDIRKTTHFPGRSINLALSHRGREALKAVDCEDLVLEHAIPMYGRYVHDQNGKSYNIQKYGLKNEYICSIGRRILNEILLSLKFTKNCAIFAKKTTFSSVHSLDSDEEVQVKDADLICGCDGAFSALRRSFLQMQDFNYSQNYIGHRYLELCIQPNSNEESLFQVSRRLLIEKTTKISTIAKACTFKMPPNYFHLWPRGSFCLIGLANQDKTFTVTLLAPKSIFDEMGENTDKFLNFFEKYFPDAYRLIGRKNVAEAFSKQKPSCLLSVKSDPHHMDDNVVLLGDAAHAMVPFYGQGMNAVTTNFRCVVLYKMKFVIQGFEDCLVLHETLDEYKENIGKLNRIKETKNRRKTSAMLSAKYELCKFTECPLLTTSRPCLQLCKVAETLKAYSKLRCIDSHAICDLAMYNYEEVSVFFLNSALEQNKFFFQLRDLVNHWSFKFRKIFDFIMYRLFPSRYIPLYNMVSLRALFRKVTNRYSSSYRSIATNPCLLYEFHRRLPTDHDNNFKHLLVNLSSKDATSYMA